MIYKVIIISVCLVLLIGSLYFIFKNKKYGNVKKNIPTIVAIASIAGLIFLPGSFHQVNTGEIAVVRHLGVVKQVRTAGVYFNFWLTDEYEYYDAKVQQVEINTQAYSKDGQTLTLKVVIQYQIQPEKVIQIATSYGGLTMLESRIETVSIERIKSVLSGKTAMETIETRNLVSKDVTDKVSEAIGEDYFVNINTVVLTNIDFTDEFERIVEEKVAAEQEAQKAVNEANKKRTEAEAAKAVAELEADAALYKATKEAEAIKVNAEAKAEAAILEAEAAAKALAIKTVEVAKMYGYTVNEVVNEDEISYEIVYDSTHTGEDIAKYIQYISYLESWDGVLPTTLVTDGSANIIIPAP